MKHFLFLLLNLTSCRYTNEKTTYLTTDTKFTPIALPQNAIPFEGGYNDIKISAQLNDSITTKIIIDTGMPQEIIIDSAFAQKHKLLKSVNFNKRILLYQILKKPHGAYFSFNNISFTLAIGNYQKTIKNFYVINLKKTYGCKADMLVGCAFLKNQLFEINYTKNYLRFFQNSSKIPNINEYNGIDLCQINRSCYAVNANFLFNSNDKFNVKLMLDTGSRRILMLTNTTKKEIQNIKAKNKGIGVIDVFYRTRYFYPANLIVGNDVMYNYLFQEPVTILTPSTEFNGIIGNGFLKEHNPIFDLKNNKLYLHKIDANTFLKKLSFAFEMGFFVHKEKSNKRRIIGVVRNSIAEKKGMHPNDNLIAIDDIPVDSLQVKDYLFQKKYIDDITLTVKRKNQLIRLKIKKVKFDK